MTTKPFFSVILPVFNGERYIAQAVESVLDQSEDDWELIIIDDCSLDRTPEILSLYSKSYAQVRVFRNEVNKNIAGSLNRGIEEADGKWMVRLDADDFFTENYLKVLRTAIENNGEDPEYFFSTWVNVVDETGQKVLSQRLPDASTIKRMMPIENFLCHPATSFSKEAWQKVGGYPVKDRTMAEDTAMWLKFFNAGMNLVMIPAQLVNYRVHQNNITSVNDARLFHKMQNKEKAAVRQCHEWRISLFLKQKMLTQARQELLSLCSIQRKVTLKNLNYLFLTFLPASVVSAFMWEIRPRLRSMARDLKGRHVRV